MSKEEIALQLTLKTLEMDYNFIGLYKAELREDILEKNSENLSHFFNEIINDLNISLVILYRKTLFYPLAQELRLKPRAAQKIMEFLTGKHHGFILSHGFRPAETSLFQSL